MTDPTGTHGVSTTLPDDLWQLFVEEAHEEDRNWSAHLRRIVKEHFARKAAEERKRNMVDDLRPETAGGFTVPTWPTGAR